MYKNVLFVRLQIWYKYGDKAFSKCQFETQKFQCHYTKTQLLQFLPYD